MYTVLTACDYSPGARAGIRFAVQWSSQQKIELIFFHVFHPIRLPQWSDKEYQEYSRKEQLLEEAKLKQYIARMYSVMKITPGKYSCIVRQGISPDISILDFCRERKVIDFICSATHGAGKLNRIFGTKTGNLVTKSQVPVIVVPETYRRRPISRILYAADFVNYKNELKTVEAFARPLAASVKVFHIDMPYEVVPDEATLLSTYDKKFAPGATLDIKRAGPQQSFFKNFKQEIGKSNPSLLVMFTDQKRTLLDRFLYPSQAEHMAFEPPVPMLVFPKGG